VDLPEFMWPALTGSDVSDTIGSDVTGRDPPGTGSGRVCMRNRSVCTTTIVVVYNVVE
jgi:hypothetical protein